MNRTIKISSNVSYYNGSGQAVLAILNGQPIDAVYYVNPMRENEIKTDLLARYPGCRAVAGMLSCYQFTAFDPSEF